MTASPYPFLPAFVSPLNDWQHAQLGRIAVLWGHNDFLLNELLINVIGITIQQRKLLIGEKPIAGKLSLLKGGLEGVKDKATKTAIASFHEIMNDLKGQRNTAFHGSWGWRANDREKTVEICARHEKTLDNPIRPANLVTMEKRLCEASRFGIDALMTTRSLNPVRGSTRFLHGRSAEPLEWFQQWLEHNPLGDATLDQNWREGELPRLKWTD